MSTNCKAQPKIIRTLINCIQNQNYLRAEEFDAYSTFGKFTKANYHQVGLVLGGYHGHDTGTQPVKMDIVFSALKLTNLKNLVVRHGNSIQVLCNDRGLYIKTPTQERRIEINFRNIVAAYVFYSIAEGDFIENVKGRTVANLKKELIAKIPSPYLDNHVKDSLKSLSIEDANIIFSVIYGYMAFVLTKCINGSVKKATKRSKFYIEPVIDQVHKEQYTNSKKVAEDKKMRLFCQNVSEEEHKRHDELFTLTTGYDGYDVDDWVYFGTGSRGGRYALSPSLGIKRKLNISEYYNL